MEKKIRIWLKILIILVCSFCLIWLIQKDKTDFQLKQPEGERITADEVFILVQALLEKTVDQTPGTDTGLEEIRIQYEENLNQDFLYEDYINILQLLLGEPEKQLLYEKKYKKEFFILKEDWYQAFDEILDLFQMKDIIRKETITVLGSANRLTEKTVDENQLLDIQGNAYTYRSEKLRDVSFGVIRAYQMDDSLLTLLEQSDETFSLENVWLMEVDDEKLQFFYQGYEICYQWQDVKEKEKAMREAVGDLSFQNGSLRDVRLKQDRAGGKLLRLGDGEIELEGKGTYPIAENCRAYRLYGELVEVGIDEPVIGYDFTDFVIDQGEVCAMLIVRKENMETIRVAIRNNGFGGLYHEEIRAVSDVDMELVYGKYEDRLSEIIPAGEEVVFSGRSEYLKGDRAELTPLAKTGKIEITSLNRNQGIPSYRGSMEIMKAKEGILLINELVLEEYLYSVVPSEMPAGYPEEALMAQAVCARTYAAQYLTRPGLGSFGANVDDSVSYQVYNNIPENAATTKAVKETAGELLLYEGEPISTYYYSTSCGFGADAGVWKESNREEMPYLTSLHISETQDGENNRDEAEAMTSEEVFSDYIRQVKEEDYERNEAWYRWEYELNTLDTEKALKRLKDRYEADKSKVLTYTGTDQDYENPENFESVQISGFQKINDISVLKRRQGGVIDELLLETNQGIFKVISEYNVRYILNQGGAVTRQDGTQTESAALLPSAYLIIDTVKKNENVIGYTIFGGGYGHGVGMSQNGAKAMALQGLTCEEILTFFYQGCVVGKSAVG